MVASIDQKILADYNQQCGSTCAQMGKTSNGDLIVAICTPLMQRVHSLIKQSSELVFIDSTGTVKLDLVLERLIVFLKNECTV